ncbi:MAG TPA: hypothetical protein VFW70_05680, partial [Methylomirabilota bacterium]|nr:hypothetical protein [Methylomirabilota bacterium]
AWDFYGAASVDGRGQQVRGRSTRDTALAILKIPGGGLRYIAREISGACDGPEDRCGSVLDSEMAPHTPQPLGSVPAKP